MVGTTKKYIETSLDRNDFCDAELDSVIRDLVKGLISQLNRPYREAVFNAEILEQSPAQIAQEMGLSEQIVCSYLKLGRKQLIRLALSTLQSAIK